MNYFVKFVFSILLVNPQYLFDLIFFTYILYTLRI